ncbi:MAG: alpha/beta fold hydrolase, partial [Syntrophobacteraceae bacterium]
NRHPLQISQGDVQLSAIAHLPTITPAPVVICCHGLLSSKDSSKYEAIAEAFTRAGLCIIRFDFSGCGESPPRKEPLIGARRRDLDAVVDFSRMRPWSDGRVGLLGSSLGGYLSIMAADERPERIGAVVSWAAPFDVSRLDPAESGENELRRGIPGGFDLGTPRDLASLSVVSRVLLIHGREDEVVPWTHAVEIYRRVNDPKDMILMQSADHRLTDESWRNSAIAESLDWFLKFFGMSGPRPGLPGLADNYAGS